MKFSHFRTLGINKSLRKNWESSVQKRLLNLGKTVSPVTFYLRATPSPLSPSVALLLKAGSIATIREI